MSRKVQVLEYNVLQFATNNNFQSYNFKIGSAKKFENKEAVAYDKVGI